MLIRMCYQVSGTRDGVEWPAPGVDFDFPDDEALILLKQGMAEAVRQAETVETATAPEAEEAVKPVPKPRGRPRKTPAKAV